MLHFEQGWLSVSWSAPALGSFQEALLVFHEGASVARCMNRLCEAQGVGKNYLLRCRKEAANRKISHLSMSNHIGLATYLLCKQSSGRLY